jgi:hypothetical protein
MKLSPVRVLKNQGKVSLRQGKQKARRVEREEEQRIKKLQVCEYRSV